MQPDDEWVPLFTLIGVSPFLLMLGVALAIGNWHLAKRLNGNSLLWAILTLIPVVNGFFFMYLGYRILFAVLDRLPIRNVGSVAPT